MASKAVGFVSGVEVAGASVSITSLWATVLDAVGWVGVSSETVLEVEIGGTSSVSVDWRQVDSGVMMASDDEPTIFANQN